MKQLKFEVVHGLLEITDPCSETVGEGDISGIKAKKGTWLVDIEVGLFQGFGGLRPRRLRARHENSNVSQIVSMVPYVVGIDTGTVLVTDYDSADTGYIDEERPDGAYEVAGNWGGVYRGTGVVCPTGFGDGGYDVIVTFDKNKEAIEVVIEFIDNARLANWLNGPKEEERKKAMVERGFIEETVEVDLADIIDYTGQEFVDHLREEITRRFGPIEPDIHYELAGTVNRDTVLVEVSAELVKSPKEV